MIYRQPNFPSVFTQGAGEIRKFDKDLGASLQGMSDNLKAILNRGISFTDNVDVRIISVASHETPGTEFSSAHGLGKVPTGYIIIGRTGAGTVYDGATANNKTTIYLKSDASAVTFSLMVF